MTRETLLALAAKVEALTGPCRTADRDIFKATSPGEVPSPIVESGYGWREDEAGWWLATGEDARTPPKTIYPQRYTSSIDAAMTLAPESWWLSAHYFCHPDFRSTGDRPWHSEFAGPVEWVTFDMGPEPQYSCEGGNAETPALSLTAAALRARAEGFA